MFWGYPYFWETPKSPYRIGSTTIPPKTASIEAPDEGSELPGNFSASVFGADFGDDDSLGGMNRGMVRKVFKLMLFRILSCHGHGS